MKIRIFLLVLVCAIAAGGAWYITSRPGTLTADQLAVVASVPKPTAKPNTIEPPKPIVPSRVAAPVAPVAPMPVASSSAAMPAVDTSTPQPQADLKSCITQTLKLLETKDIAGMVKSIMPPSEMQKMIDRGRASSVEDIVAQFSQRPDFGEKMNQLQQVLEIVKDQSPELSADGLSATFKFNPGLVDPNGPGRSGTITFIQIEGNWYLR